MPATQPKQAALDPRAGDPPRRAPADGLFLFLFILLLYAATSSGDLITDSETRWLVAKRLLDTGWVDLDPGQVQASAIGVDGRAYCIWAMGQSLCYVPFVLAGRGLAALPLPIAGSADMFGQFLASLLMFPAFGAACAVLVYRIVRDAGGTAAGARATALLTALGTMHWQHTINTMEESQVALCLLLSVWAMQRVWQHDRWTDRLLVLLAMGLAVSFRYSAAVMCAPIGLVGFAVDLAARRGWPQRTARIGQWFAAGAAGLLPFLAAIAWFNHVRFGSWTETGYGLAYRDGYGGLGMFATPLLDGLAGMLLSPGKSVLLYNPVLLLAIPGFLLLCKRSRGLAAIIAAVLATTLIFHARFTVWAGDLTWGPRYLASTLGIAMLAAWPILSAGHARTLVWTIAATSIAIQLASTVYSLGLEFYQDRRQGLIPGEHVWRPAESQLVRRVRNIALHLAGRRILTSIPPDEIRPELHQTPVTPEEVHRLHTVAYFPFKAYYNTGSTRVLAVMLALWLGLIAAAAGVALAWRRAAQRAAPAAGAPT